MASQVPQAQARPIRHQADSPRQRHRRHARNRLRRRRSTTERAGAASALSETGAELGGALGIALLGSLGLAIYRAHLADTLPTALTPTQEHAATNTLADATNTSTQLQRPASGELFHAAAAAFTDSLQTVATAAAAVTLLLALLAAALLHTTAPAAEHG